MTQPAVQIRPLCDDTFADFELLTSCQEHGGCYCAFWHQKIASMDSWKARQKDAPELNRQCIVDRVRSGFHVGALAYEDGALLAWISVAPLPEIYWAWRRVGQLGDAANGVAGITCITAVPERRGGVQTRVLAALRQYGAARAWTALEGYPFDESAAEKQGASLAWAGHPRGYAGAGFERIGAHWLSRPGAERSIWRAESPPASE